VLKRIIEWLWPPTQPTPDPTATLLLSSLEKMLSTMNGMSAAQMEQSKALSQWLGLFKTNQSPSSHTVREEDEWERELIRAGYPIQGTPEDQGQWVLAQSEREDG
jgi:hypothetical protein